MPIQALAAGARVASSAVKGSTKVKKAPSRRSQTKKKYQAANDNAAKAANDNMLRISQTYARNEESHDEDSDNLSHTAATILAARVSFQLGGMFAWTVPLQLILALVSLIGLGVEYAAADFLWGFFEGFVPGDLLFVSMYAVIITIGLLSSATALLFYTLSGVDCLKKQSLLILIFCTIGYFIPIINCVPWVYVWLFTVARQK